MTVRVYAADSMLYRTVGLIQSAIDALGKSDPEYYKKMAEATERFAIEASMAKVFGSESSNLIVDHALQIHGGNGFTEEYPLARAYRDDRINRIWEGTNEINRMIVTGYMMKKVLMEEISLRDYLKGVDDFLATESPDIEEDLFQSEKFALESAKRLASMVFQEALCEYGQDLKHEQQLSEALSDIFTYIYTAGSVISRARQSQSSNGISNMSSVIARIFTAESLLDVKSLSNICLNKIFKENIPADFNDTVIQLESRMTLNTDTISLKQSLADFMYSKNNYPF